MIRKANISDAISIQKIMVHDLKYEVDFSVVKDRLCNTDEKREAVFVYEADQEIVGVVHIEIYHSLYYKKIANILCLAVAEKYRRHGVGSELIKCCREWAIAHNLSAIRLESSMHRKSAHEFYRAVGFDNEKEQIRFLMSL